MLVHRVFPHLRSARAGEPGHPGSVHGEQGFGRWDNPDRYRALYLAATPSGAIGESFAHLTAWSAAMLPFPALAGSTRALATGVFDEERHPVLDLDDARTLLDRGLRPTDVVIRDRPRTQRLAADVFAEGRWSGLAWWSMHRPQWRLLMLWDPAIVDIVSVEPLVGHPGLLDASHLLGRSLDDDLRR